MSLAKLHDGTQVDTASEDWKWECLAQHVLRIRGLDNRRGWLDQFARANSTDSADRLRTRMQAIHDARRRLLPNHG